MKILILLFSFSLFALDTFVGRILMLRGKAYRINDNSGNKTPIAMGDKVYVKDTLETKTRSLLKVKLVDDSTLTIGSDSQFYVKNFDFKSKVDRTAVFNMMKGKLRAAIPIKSKKDSIKFKSQSVAMAVRGTKFIMDVETKDGVEVSQFALLEGKISLEELKTSQKQEILPGDKYVHASGSKGNKTINKKLSAKELDQLNKTIDDKTKTANLDSYFLKPFQIDIAMLNQSPSVKKQNNRKIKKSGSELKWKKNVE